MQTSVFIENLDYVPAVAQKRFVRKPKRRAGITTLKELSALSAKCSLKPEESKLLEYIEIDRLGFSQIADIIGCSRQNVEQKYKAILIKTGHLEPKK